MGQPPTHYFTHLSELRAGGSSFHWIRAASSPASLSSSPSPYTSTLPVRPHSLHRALSPSCAVRLAGTGVDLYLASTLVAGSFPRLPHEAAHTFRMADCRPRGSAPHFGQCPLTLSPFPPHHSRASTRARRGGGCWCRGLQPLHCRPFAADHSISLLPFWFLRCMRPLPPCQMLFPDRGEESRSALGGRGEPVSSHRTFPSALVQHPFNSDMCHPNRVEPVHPSSLRYRGCSQLPFCLLLRPQHGQLHRHCSFDDVDGVSL